VINVGKQLKICPVVSGNETVVFPSPKHNIKNGLLTILKLSIPMLLHPWTNPKGHKKCHNFPLKSCQKSDIQRIISRHHRGHKKKMFSLTYSSDTTVQVKVKWEHDWRKNFHLTGKKIGKVQILMILPK
jgi:hypothetical protein